MKSLAVEYASPSFAPHATLLSGIPIDTSLESLEDEISRGIAIWKTSNNSLLELMFEEDESNGLGSHAGNRWESLFIKIIPSPPLLALRSAIQSSLTTVSSTKLYYPHCSLMYVDQTPDKPVEATIRSINNGGKLNGINGFKSEQVILMRCEGEVKDWMEIKRFALFSVVS